MKALVIMALLVGVSASRTGMRSMGSGHWICRIMRRDGFPVESRVELVLGRWGCARPVEKFTPEGVMHDLERRSSARWHRRKRPRRVTHYLKAQGMV